MAGAWRRQPIRPTNRQESAAKGRPALVVRLVTNCAAHDLGTGVYGNDADCRTGSRTAA